MLRSTDPVPPLAATASPPESPVPPLPPPVPAYALDGLIGLTMAQIERRVIEETIARHGGSVTRASRVLDLSPSTIYRKMESWARGE